MKKLFVYPVVALCLSIFYVSAMGASITINNQCNADIGASLQGYLGPLKCIDSTHVQTIYSGTQYTFTGLKSDCGYDLTGPDPVTCDNPVNATYTIKNCTIHGLNTCCCVNCNTKKTPPCV